MSGLLEGGSRMKHLKLTALDAATEKQITEFVRAAVAANLKRGDPTKR